MGCLLRTHGGWRTLSLSFTLRTLLRRLRFYPTTSGGGALWFSNQKEGNVLFNNGENRPKWTACHRHTAMLLEDSIWPRDCLLASRPWGRQLKLRTVFTEKQKATFFLLGHWLPAQSSYTSACRVLIHYSIFLIHYKLHLNFLAHVHLWDIFILSSFFMYHASKKRPSSVTYSSETS